MSNTPQKTRKPGKWLDVIPQVIYGVIALILVVIFVTVFGRVSGEEFSPEAFARRRYRFYRLPFTAIQILPTRHDDASNVLEKRIASDLSVVPGGHPTARWDLVTSSRPGYSTYEGDAKILTDLLSLRDKNGDLIWNRWSSQNQELADILWPVISDVARARLYVLVPDILDAARSASAPERLREEIQLLIGQESFRIARRLQENDQHELAIRALDLVVAHGSGGTRTADEITESRRQSEQAILAAGGTREQLEPVEPTELRSSFADDKEEDFAEAEVTEEDFSDDESSEDAGDQE